MPANPLQAALDMRPSAPSTQAKATLGYQRPTQSTLDIPIQTFAVWDSVQLVQAALTDLEQGVFLNASILCDAMGRDSRITATMYARVNGLLSLPLDFTPGIDNAKGKQVVEDLRVAWPKIFPGGTLAQLLRWGRLCGAAPGQLTWANVDSPSSKQWLPTLKVWHPQFITWRWDWRDFQVVTMSDGIQRLQTGLGNWTLYTPNGRYPAWQTGLVRGLAIPFLIRWWALRDWARWSEKHGLPIFGAIVPKGADEAIKERFFNSLSAIGTENTVKLEQDSARPGGSFDVKLLEPQANSWAGFKGLVNQQDADIAITVLGQNLTTEVNQGSRAAAEVHDQVRSDFKKADADSLAQHIRDEILRPWAAFNYGDPELAPTPKWTVDQPQDSKKIADTALSVSTALSNFKNAGSPVDDRALLDELGIPTLSKAAAAKLLADKATADAKSASDAQALAATKAAGQGTPPAAGQTPPGKPAQMGEDVTSMASKVDPPMPRAAVEGQPLA